MKLRGVPLPQGFPANSREIPFAEGFATKSREINVLEAALIARPITLARNTIAN